MPQKVTGKKLQWLESQVESDAKTINILTSFVKDNRLNCLCLTVENGESRKPLNELEGKTSEAAASPG